MTPGGGLYTLVWMPETRVPPERSLDEQKAAAIMKQLITLSFENWVALSVQSMNKKQKKNVPMTSEVIAANHLLYVSVSLLSVLVSMAPTVIGSTSTWWHL